jgi:hypothetical protein
VMRLRIDYFLPLLMITGPDKEFRRRGGNSGTGPDLPHSGLR